MEIIKVKFGRVINTGNYGNDRYSLTAKVSPEDNVFEVLDDLKEFIEISHKTPNLSEELARLEERQKKARSEARELEKEVMKLQQEVNELRKEKKQLRELFDNFLKDAIPPEAASENEAVDPDDIPFDSTNI
jgi:chromosome segregation ATPase